MKKEEFIRWLSEATEGCLVICVSLVVSLILLTIKYLFFV
jgi:hypothetical protein